MRNLKGLQWKELTEGEKEKLYLTAYVDSDNIDLDTGECIIDFNDSLSISGIIKQGEEQEIIIDNESVLYDPTN